MGLTFSISKNKMIMSGLLIVDIKKKEKVVKRILKIKGTI